MVASRKPTGRATFGRTRRVRQFHETSQTALGRKRRAATRQAVETSFARHKYRQKRLPRQHAAGATHKVLLPPVSEQHPLITAKSVQGKAAPTLKEKPKLGGPTKLTPEPGSKKGKAPTGNTKRRRKYIRKAKRHSGSTTSPASSGTEVGVDTIIGGGMALILIGMIVANGQTTAQILTWLGSSIATLIRNLTNPGGSAGG